MSDSCGVSCRLDGARARRPEWIDVGRSGFEQGYLVDAASHSVSPYPARRSGGRCNAGFETRLTVCRTRIIDKKRRSAFCEALTTLSKEGAVLSRKKATPLITRPNRMSRYRYVGL